MAKSLLFKKHRTEKTKRKVKILEISAKGFSTMIS